MLVVPVVDDRAAFRDEHGEGCDPEALAEAHASDEPELRARDAYLATEQTPDRAPGPVAQVQRAQWHAPVVSAR